MMGVYRRVRPLATRVPMSIRAAVAGLILGVGLTAAIGLIGLVAVAVQQPELVTALTSRPENLLMLLELIPRGIAAGFLAAMGAPVEWNATLVGTTSGQIAAGSFPPALVPVALSVPLAAAARMGYVAARGGGGIRVWAPAALAFTGACWALGALADGRIGVDAFLGAEFHIPIVAALLLPTLWALGGLRLGLLMFRWRSGGVLTGAQFATRSAPILAGVLALSIAAAGLSSGDAARDSQRAASPLAQATTTQPVTAPAAGKPLRRHARPRAEERISTTRAPRGSHSGGALAHLERDATRPVEVGRDSRKGPPSFLSTRLPVAVAGVDRSDPAPVKARAVLERYGALLGAHQPARQLVLDRDRPSEDELGMDHVRFNQHYRGVEVFGSTVSVHFDRSGEAVTALVSSFTPGVEVQDMQASVSPDEALEAGRKGLPAGELVERPRLVVYAGKTAERVGRSASLAWIVDLRDDRRGLHNLYVVDAHKGAVIDIVPKQLDARSRATYQWNGSLPGTLRRTEGMPPVGLPDVDSAHDFVGEAYDYYWSRFGRDSYNGGGASLRSTAYYNPPKTCPNAFWNGSQLILCPGMATKDIVAHELTHAVTDHTADLVYFDQPGALNESYSDIFAAMVDRANWTIGEGSAAGPIRDMSNPGRFDQPDHAIKWVLTYEDSCGVHTNSGIHNEAFYNVATDSRMGDPVLAREKAGRIFYRALTTYLNPLAGYGSATLAAQAAAVDLYGFGSQEHKAAVEGFAAVGLPFTPIISCPPQLRVLYYICSATVGLSDQGASADQAIDTLHRFRDEVMAEEPAGRHYMDLYEENTERLSVLMLQEPELRSEAGDVLGDLTPQLGALADGNGDEVVLSADLADRMKEFLGHAAAADRASGGGSLAADFEEEVERLDPEDLAGLTLEEVVEEANQRAGEEPDARGEP